MEMPKGVTLERASFEFSQDSDSCEANGLGQVLTVALEDAGGGLFPVISTTRWALDDDEIDAFAAILKWCLTVPGTFTKGGKR